MSASPTAAIGQLEQDRSALVAQRGAMPPDPTADILQQKQTALAPVEKAIQTESSQLPTPPGKAALPEAPNKPLVDSGEYSKLSGMLIGMALISGVASRGNWYGASASLNGALKGYLEGNKANADQAWKKYQADYDKAVEQHKEQQQEYMDVLNNKKLSINQKFQEWSMLAAKYDDQQKLALSRRKSYDEMTKSIIGMDEHIATLTVNKEKVDNAVKKSTGGGDDPRVRAVYGAMADAGISFPPGMRSIKSQNETIQGLLEAHPEDSATQIAARVKAGELGVKAAQTELGVVARREGASAAAINALNRDGGLYDQLVDTAKKIDFGSSKFVNSMRLYSQGQAIADPDISEYVNALADTRAEFASVLARGGQVTDSVRIASEHAFPDKMSLSELQRNVDRSKKIAAAIQAGNTSVADALINGKSMEEALKSPDKAAPAAHPEDIQSLLDKYK